MTDIWFERYKPKKLKDIIGNGDVVTNLNDWIKKFYKDKKCKKTVLLKGNHGTGKEVIVSSILSKNGYYSDWVRTCDDSNSSLLDNIENIHGKLNRGDYIKDNKRYALVIDDFENLSSSNKNHSRLLAIVKDDKYNFPKILISSLKYNAFIKNIPTKKLDTYKLSDPTNNQALILMNKIIEKENINIDSINTKKKILNFSQRDMRKLIITLYDLKMTFGDDEIDKASFKRWLKYTQRKEVEDNVFDLSSKIMNRYQPLEKCIKFYKTDKGVSDVIQENFYKTISFVYKKHDIKNSTTMKNITNSMSMGDTIMNKMLTDQKYILRDTYIYYTCAKPSYLLNKYDNRIGSYRMSLFGQDTLDRQALATETKNIADWMYLSVSDIDHLNSYIYKLIKKKKAKKLYDLAIEYEMDVKMILDIATMNKSRSITGLNSKNKVIVELKEMLKSDGKKKI